MPTGKSWGNFIYVNLGFVAYIYITIIVSTIQQIKADWPKYRCNPIYMPLAPDIGENFIYCIQSTQINFMGFLLEPLTFITKSVSNILGGFLTEINYVRAMFDKIRTFFSTIFSSIFGVFLNLVIEFQKITIGITDMVGKIIGVLVTVMYILDGSIQTMQSAWNGPAGQMVKVLGKCFHPETKLKLKNGKVVHMQDIILGDVLENGSKVYSIMKIDNKDNPEPFYAIKKRGFDDADIYVTGSHLVYDIKTSKFIKVKDYSGATKTDVIYDYFSCLITDDHQIQIGSEIFWDWEDHFIKNCS